MTISSSTASRRYLDRSSFTSASATSFGRLRWRPFFVEPRLGFGRRDNREDVNVRLCNVIKHPDVANTESVLRLAEATESLDSALADFRRLVRQMHCKRLRRATARLKILPSNDRGSPAAAPNDFTRRRRLQADVRPPRVSLHGAAGGRHNREPIITPPRANMATPPIARKTESHGPMT